MPGLFYEHPRLKYLMNTGKMKIRGVMASKGDASGYVNKMQQEIFQVLQRRGALRISSG
jgi:hypothetical protein